MFQNSSINLNLSDDVKGTVLVKSSDQSWLMKDNIIMHPLYITPVAENERSSYNLAVLAEGKFASQFDKNILEQNKNDVAKDSLAGGTNNHLAKAVQNGKIFVAGSSVIVSPMLIDDSGREPISIFVRNVLDYMNGNEDLCLMRTKGLSLNTLNKTSAGSVKVAKIINQYGVPFLVLVVGFVIWRMRVKHRRKIRIEYAVKGNVIRIYDSIHVCSLVINDQIFDQHYGVYGSNFCLKGTIGTMKAGGRPIRVEAKMGFFHMRLYCNGQLVAKKFMAFS
jgi:hypothetical protein